MKIRPYFPTTIRVDDPDSGDYIDLRIRVKRQSVEEAAQFRREYYQSANPSSAARVARLSEGDEQAKTTVANGDEEYVVSDADVRARRLNAMTEDDREEFEALEREETAFHNAFLIKSIREYVTVETDQIENEKPDGTTEWVTTGAQMLALFGGRQDVLSQLLRAVDHENRLSVAAKKALRSLYDFARSSAEHKLAAIGEKRAPTAASAGNAASAETEAVINPAPTPSGSAAGESAS